MGKKQQRQQAAMAMRKQREAEARRKKLLFGGAIAVAVILIGGLIGVGIWMNQDEDHDVVTPQADHSDDGAIQAGNGDTEVTVYLDYGCPGCQHFELTFGEQIKEWVENDDISLSNHPLNYQVNLGDRFALRAGAASVCAADEGESEYLDFSFALFNQQPETASDDVSNDEMIQIGEDQGLSDDFSSCVTEGTYMGWVEDGSEEARNSGIESTPTVLVNGEQVETENFADVVQASIDNNNGSD